MATSYGAVARQAKIGTSAKDKLDNIQKSGINVSDFTIVAEGRGGERQEWGENGLIARSYSEEDGKYDSKQLKLLSNGIFLTDDSWRTVRSAIGEFQYKDTVTGDEETLYGINAGLLIGNLILGKNLIIKNDSGTMSFDGGLSVTNGVNTFIVNPNSSRLIRLISGSEELMYVDNTGKLYLCGDGTAINISGNDQIREMIKSTNDNVSSIEAHEKRISDVESKAENNASAASDNLSAIQNLSSSYQSMISDYGTFKDSTSSDLNSIHEDIQLIKDKLEITDRE